MDSFEIIGHKRANLGRREAQILRRDSKLPGVLYGGKEPVHFYTYMYLLNKFFENKKVQFVDLNLEGNVYRCIVQEVQKHPVSEMFLHVDMFEIADNKKIRMNVPIVTKGNSPGVAMGGLLSLKSRKVPVCAFPQNMPEFIEVDLSNLQLKDIVRVKDIKIENYKILKELSFPLVSIDLSRALKSATSKENKG